MFENIADATELFAYRLGVAMTMEHDSLNLLRTLEDDAHDPSVKELFARHADETLHQIENLNRVASISDIDLVEEPSPATGGLAKEVAALLHKTDATLRDTVTVSAGLEAEHYEISVYQTLIATATAFGASKVAELLTENLGQERDASEQLHTVASQIANALAGVARSEAAAVSD